MAKADQEAFNIIVELVNKGYTIQIDNTFGYTLSVWPDKTKFNHAHYDGDTLIDALLKCKKNLLNNK